MALDNIHDERAKIFARKSGRTRMGQLKKFGDRVAVRFEKWFPKMKKRGLGDLLGEYNVYELINGSQTCVLVNCYKYNE